MRKLMLGVGVLLAAAMTAAQAAALPFVVNQPAAKTAVINLIAGDGSANGGMNFNGGFKGDKTYVIPFGWKVIVKFRDEGVLAHSAIVIPRLAKLPVVISPSQAAFPGAFVKNLNQGWSKSQGVYTFSFTANKAGDFYIACGVPGHALAGQYIDLVISKSAKAASFK